VELTPEADLRLEQKAFKRIKDQSRQTGHKVEDEIIKGIGPIVDDLWGINISDDLRQHQQGYKLIVHSFKDDCKKRCGRQQ
jgi:hypothetical protein